ncbi:MAG: putative transport system permease protein [Acidimicrobiaceae bacterium]|nr:putative transport system permease protein [Acidimicrobiaceae bacterium]
MAATSIRRRFGRSVLTVAAVALAATLLTALVTIAGTARTKVLSELSKGGPLSGINVAAAEADPSQVDTDDPKPGPPKDLDDVIRSKITALPDVTSVLPIVAAVVNVVVPEPPANAEVLSRLPPLPSTLAPTTTAPRNPNVTAPRPVVPGLTTPDPFPETMVGIDLDHASLLPITILTGRLPVPHSLTEVAVTQGYLTRMGLTKKQAAAVVGTEVQLGAPRVFSDSGLPQRFRSRWLRATIVGVVAQETAPGQFIVSLEQSRAARAWTAAGGDAGGRVQIPTSPYSGLFVIASNLDKVNEVRRDITELGYSTSAPENLVASVQRYLRVVEIVLGAIGAIALVIASLGIANALLAAVRERRREIGVLKAIGARDRDVQRVFLFEAGVLGLVGGTVGTAGGFATALGVSAVVNQYLAAQGLAGVHLGLPVLVLVSAVLGSTLLALVAGAVPARRAARMPAREAMEAA